MLIAFYIFAILAVAGAFSVLILRNPVYCALSLVGTFFFIAAIFVLLNQEFVAAIQILIYAGAIMVLFLFVIMLLNLRVEGPRRFHIGIPQVIGIGLAVGLLAQLGSVFASARSIPAGLAGYSVERIAREGAVEVVGELLFKEYVLPFEVISILLMVSVMGAVVLAKKRPKDEGEG